MSVPSEVSAKRPGRSLLTLVPARRRYNGELTHKVHAKIGM